MDPISALSAASSLLTFAQVGCQLFAGARHIHRSADGQTKSNRDLHLHADRLASLCSDLKTTANTPHGPHNQNDDPALRAVCQQCIDASQELQSALERVVAQPHQLWPSVRAAIRTVLSESDINNLERRLARCSSDIQAHLLSVLRSQNSAMQVQLDAIQTAQHRMQLQSRSDLENLRDNLVETLSTKHPADRGHHLTVIEQDLLTLRKNLDSENLQVVVLSNLDFADRTARHRAIRDHHQDTFAWIFDSTHANIDVRYTEWLRSDASLFWISGKAGSGKSTMIKYIYDHPETLEGLKEWAGDSHLLTAEFFFWNAGSLLQKSLEGLLRSLLFQLCQQPTHWTPAIWELAASHNHDFSNKDCLLDMLQLLTTLPETSTKFCFFIDGADEFSGEPREIAQAIKAIASIPNVKVCCSSRPWNAFESGFARSNGYVLAIHDHTKDDIAEYVACTLRTDPDFVELLSFDSEYALVASEILARAEGVFLWVRLVVSSVLDVLPNKDSSTELLQRVRGLPRDLEGMYGYILNRIDERYRRQAAIIIQMAVHVEAQLPLMVVDYVSLDSADLPDMPLDPTDHPNLPLKIWSVADRNAYSAIVRNKLKARCLDLIEATPSDTPGSAPGGPWALKFLHRTVYDYLSNQDTQKVIGLWIGPNALHPEQELCRAYLHLLKTLPLQSVGEFPIDIEAVFTVRLLLLHARFSEEWSMPILREVERVMNALAQYPEMQDLGLPTYLFVHSAPLDYRATNKLYPHAVAMCMTDYVSECLKRDPSLAGGASGMDSFLFIMHGLVFYRDHYMQDYSSVARVLLSYGADASCALPGGSENSLSDFATEFEDSGMSKRKSMVPLFEVLVQYGYLKQTSTPGTFKVRKFDANRDIWVEEHFMNFKDLLDSDDVERLEAAVPPARQTHEIAPRKTGSDTKRSRARLFLRKIWGSGSESAEH